MSKTKNDFMEERNRIKNIPKHLAEYPMIPDEAFAAGYELLKDCPECYGTCVIPDSFNLSTGKEDVCPYCHGTGQVYMIKQDLANELENEIIRNAKMMNDD